MNNTYYNTSGTKRAPRFEQGTCSTAYVDFIDGFFSKIQDSFFYVNVLQFAIVTLMYINVGRGRYWKILFYAATAGFIGCLIENSTVAFICRKEDEYNSDKYQMVIPFFLAEFCWVLEEYAIPFLNLTKMNAFSKGKLSKAVNYLIIGLFPVFVCCRFYIGYQRMRTGLLTTKETKYGHSVAFSVMAVADLICTFAILYFVKKHNDEEAIKSSNITNYVKRSSYIILVCVDVVGVLLAVTNFFTEYLNLHPSIVNPLHCIKCSFILILASDALLFKYSVNTSSINESSDNYRYNDNNYSSSYYKNSSLNKSRNNYSTDYNYKKNITSPTSYATMEYNSPDVTSYKSKNIVKNYTNIKPVSQIYDTPPAQSFGFLYQQNDY